MMTDTTATAAGVDLGDDLLEGAEEIAKFMFRDKNKRRRVYHLAESKNPIPVFRMGSILCARKSTLLRWIAEPEKAAVG
jgi:hypothetical protein